MSAEPMTTDRKLRDLERRLREGDAGARLMLTFERVRVREGFLICFDRPVEGCAVLWVTRQDRFGKPAPGLKGRNAQQKSVHGIIRGLAVLDVADMFDLQFRHKGMVSCLLDLVTGRFVNGAYPRAERVTSIQCTPPKGARAKAGVQGGY